ncbi:1-phosphatidylinositol 4,5-bisphosphate phosphodiesterase delta-4-like isoform X2 [Homarus americanus]|uniref:1-phosphatidylinositol 4,5-bisphosphate phosphodiesterase delta-4-like isoform X2 n=1 Tax=Homarus americanus TaxID=6706 RepID=UPI001C48ABC7|nr:1-phosphatidylinositol 4,5-bisphosphate phosphodiesterase delta-4-like isoform X2 [Homarus americanus]
MQETAKTPERVKCVDYNNQTETIGGASLSPSKEPVSLVCGGSRGLSLLEIQIIPKEDASAAIPTSPSSLKHEVDGSKGHNQGLHSGQEGQGQKIGGGGRPGNNTSRSGQNSPIASTGEAPLVSPCQPRFANFLQSTDKKVLVRNRSMEEVVQKIHEGSTLWKVRGVNKWFHRHFKVDMDNMCLVGESKKWWSPGGGAVPLLEITEVREGWKTDTFNKVSSHTEKMKDKTAGGEEPVLEESKCFSVIHGPGGRDVLDLVAATEDERDAWVSGLSHLVQSVKSLHEEKQYDVWLRKQFVEADKDNNGSLNFNECCSLLKQLNIKMDKTHAKKLFNQANTSKQKRDGDQVLEVGEFVSFYHTLLKMPEIEKLYKKYASEKSQLMSADQLCAFLQKEQGLPNYDANQATTLINEFEISDLKDQGYMTQDGFYHMLLSDMFDIFNHEHQSHVHMDMTQPLSHYYISSSHNTYLTGHQLAGESSVEGYISALKRGCRLLELDVWDGDDGEPIIYHGHTLTSKITLADVLRDGIKAYAFEVSPYPVILSIENHLGVEQQKVMVNLMKDILGDMLATDQAPADITSVPSPEELKNKIIIRGKKPQGSEVESDDDDDDDQDTIDYIDSDDGAAQTKKDFFTPHLKTFYRSFRSSMRARQNSTKKRSVSQQPEQKPHKPLAPELREVVNVCEGKKFTTFLDAFETYKCVHTPSIGETKAKGLFESSPDDFIKFTERNVTKIYPLGTRADSSNLKPYPFWSVGCQIVALNMQTEDKANFYNDAVFSTNGKCGYVLKPDILLKKEPYSPTELSDRYTKIVRVTVLSGQHLPNSVKKGDIVDPYVQVKVRGHPLDKQKQRSKVVKNNGFNPVWNETLELSIKVPQVSLVYFSLRDESLARDPVLGLCCIPFRSISTGYRFVHFTEMGGKSLAPAALFVHIDISDK